MKIVSHGIETALVAIVAAGVLAGSSSATDATLPLSLTGAPIPQFRVVGYPTLIVSGTYPRVARSELDLHSVNRRLRQAVVIEEQRFARFLRAERRHIPAASRRAMHGGFSTRLTRPLSSASTSLVSALMPTKECEPGSTACDVWFSVKVRVPSGDAVTLRQLFTNPVHGLTHLARLAQRRLLAQNGCVTPANHDPEGFAPTWSNYRAFALTPTGLAIGFGIGRVGSQPAVE